MLPHTDGYACFICGSQFPKWKPCILHIKACLDKQEAERREESMQEAAEAEDFAELSAEPLPEGECKFQCPTP